MAAARATAGKQRLSAERVVEGAVALADEIGVEALTIRRLADALDTKPMSIYHHVAGKEAILDGMVDRVFAEIAPPPDVSDALLYWMKPTLKLPITTSFLP